ncbi:unnamed protein product [Allacma fusca]|uniref:Uncharacterized protein n=1 Tax=Allacma fusca TaxID=39272 RepID=A0A8J2KK24_9HEXA|nr:unnamed protein product [Allacma fusca]
MSTGPRFSENIKSSTNPNPQLSNRGPANFGGFSFESESLPDFSEFEENTSESVDPVKTRRPSEGKMAPVTTIETVTISRPLKYVMARMGEDEKWLKDAHAFLFVLILEVQT